MRDYRRWYPLSAEARTQRHLNPGLGTVSVCVEPRVGVAVIEGMLAAGFSGRLRVLLGHRLVAATVDGDRITSVTLEALGEEPPWRRRPDATETGSSCPRRCRARGPAREPR